MDTLTRVMLSKTFMIIYQSAVTRYMEMLYPNSSFTRKL